MNENQRPTQKNDEPEWLCCGTMHFTCFLAQPLRATRLYLFGLRHACWFLDGWFLVVNLGITFWIIAEGLWEILGKNPSLRDVTNTYVQLDPMQYLHTFKHVRSNEILINAISLASQTKHTAA